MVATLFRESKTMHGNVRTFVYDTALYVEEKKELKIKFKILISLDKLRNFIYSQNQFDYQQKI